MATANFYAPGFDDQIEQQNIDRQRKYADLLRQQAQEPMAQGQMVGKHFVAPSWTQGLAKMLQSYQAGQSLNEADAKQTALAEAVKSRRADEWGKITPLLTGRDAQFALPEGESGPQIPAQAPNLKGAYAQAMQSQDPSLQQFGMSGMAKLPEIEAAHQERTDARDWRTKESEAARAARAEELRLRSEDARTSQAERLAAQKELREMQIQAQKDTQRMIAANRPERQAQIIQTEQGPMQLVGGKAMPIVGPDGKPVQGVKTTGALPDASKQKDAVDALTLLKQAAPLVRGATGSTIGAGADWLAGTVGMAPKGAENIAQLKAISGMLVAKMPKMSGPQSDKDVQLYREMAGNIGDPNVPTKLKEKAMATIAEIQSRYAGVQTPELDFAGKAKTGATGGWDIQAVSE